MRGHPFGGGGAFPLTPLQPIPQCNVLDFCWTKQGRRRTPCESRCNQTGVSRRMRMENTRLMRSVVTMTSLVALTAGLAGCGSSRSVEAFCETHNNHKAQYLAAFDAANSAMAGGDFLAGLMGAGTAVGDLNTMWKDLAKVAPDDIRTDVEIVADGWAKQSESAAEAADNPLKALASSLAGSFTLAGPMSRVDEYVRTHCD